MKSFQALLDSLNNDADTKRVKEFPKDKDTNKTIRPTGRTLGPTYLEEGEIFSFDNVREDGNLFEGLGGSYFTIVKIYDNNNNEIGGKQFYLSSLCKTLYEYRKDPETGKAVKVYGSYICSDGQVSKDAENKDLVNFIQSLGNRKIKVKEVKTITTNNKFGKPSEDVVKTGSVFVLDYAN